MQEKKLTYTVDDVDRMMLEAVHKPEKYLEYRKEFYKASNFIERPDAPVHLDIELINTCNYSCRFCEHGRNPKNNYYRKEKVLAKNKVFEILKECASVGVRSVQFSVINEPLLYPHIVEVVEYSSILGFDDIFFMSNGSLLNKYISEKLLKAGLTKLMVSIDAFSPETYEKIRNSKKYNKVVQNVLQFVEMRDQIGRRLPLVRISFLITPFNKHEAKDYEKYWKDKVDFIAFQNLIHTKGDNVNRQTTKDIKGYRCNMPNFRITVKADGSVKPCCTSYGDMLNFGNIYKSSIQDIYESDCWKDFQDMHENGEWYKHSVCKKCVMNTSFDI